MCMTGCLSEYLIYTGFIHTHPKLLNYYFLNSTFQLSTQGHSSSSLVTNFIIIKIDMDL